ncbi:MAG: TRAP transporter large permease subunit [Azospirillum sp.]|nr:TRAP transporter large permease subunit [Azospirillum sp.]MCZ8123218.1 TRAP transporter large permease subunit [Magnetospirillum sp.]
MIEGAAIWMFPALFALVFAGVPVGFALIVVAAIFGYGFFGEALGRQMFGRLVEVSSGFAFAAVPAFVFMGAVLEKSGIAERLFDAMRLWLGRLPGGLALAAIAMAAIFAAATGIIGAVEVVIGLMAIPPMMAARYDKRLVAGTICAGGSLGTIVPPSVTAVIYGLVAQVPISDLLAGILIPGALTVGLFMGYILLRCAFDPTAGPPAPPDERPLAEKLALTARALLPAAALIACVLGAIFAGIASPTEAAATGAAGALALAGLHGRLDAALVRDAARRTALVTAMIMTIVFGGTLFSSVFHVQGGGELVRGWAAFAAARPEILVPVLLGIVFAMGFVLDWATIVLLCVPVFAPLLQSAGVDPLWFGVAMLVCIQTSYLTPPMAPAIFYLQSVAPPGMTYLDICRGVVPFLICQLLVLAAVLAFPWTATWLPGAMGDFR